LLRKAKRKG